jgi:hypothetical protein
MRLSSALIGTVLLAVAPSALGAEPCFPQTIRPYHVSALATASPDSPGLGSVTSVASDPAGNELQLQADCLAWEASLSPKAESIGVVPLGAPASSGATRTHVAAPTKTVRIGYGTSGTPLHSSSPAVSLFEATPGTGAFALGATLIPAP